MDMLDDEGTFTSRFRDCLVSVDCGSDGVYQGEVDQLNSQKGELILSRVIRNGMSMGALKTRLSAAKIKDIKAYRKASTSTAETARSQAEKAKKQQLATPAGTAASKANKASNKAGEFVGCLVSVDCGDDGCYQGKVCEVNATRQSITLEAALRDGFLMKTGKVTLLGSNILDLTVVKMPEKEEPASGSAKSEAGTAPPSSSRGSTLHQPKVVLLRQNGGKAEAQNKTKPTTKPVNSPNGQKGKKAWGQPPTNPQWQPSATKKEIPTQHSKPPRHHTSTGRGFQEPTPPLPSRTAIVDEDDGPTGIPSLDSANARRTMKYASHRDRDSGPSGVPSLDSANGYTSRHPGGGQLEEPLDYSLMRHDFDFDSNLAEFSKLELSEGEESDDESESDTT